MNHFDEYFSDGLKPPTSFFASWKHPCVLDFFQKGNRENGKKKVCYAWMTCWEVKKLDVDVLLVGSFWGKDLLESPKSQGSSKIMLQLQCLM